MKDEVIMIITRSTNTAEWVEYCGFNNANVVLVNFDSTNITKRYQSFNGEQLKVEINNGTKVIFFRGETGEIPINNIDLLISNNTKVLIIIHASNDTEFAELKITFEKKFSINNNQAVEITRRYSLGDSPNNNNPVYAFETVIKANDYGKVDVAYRALYKFVKKQPNPHLIALSILCQGYLVAHGETESLKGWDDKLKNMLINGALEKTEDKAWWMETINIEEAEKELGDKGNGKVKALLNAFNKEEIIWAVVTKLVIEANKALPKILQEKG